MSNSFYPRRLKNSLQKSFCTCPEPRNPTKYSFYRHAPAPSSSSSSELWSWRLQTPRGKFNFHLLRRLLLAGRSLVTHRQSPLIILAPPGEIGFVCFDGLFNCSLQFWESWFRCTAKIAAFRIPRTDWLLRYSCSYSRLTHSHFCVRQQPNNLSNVNKFELSFCFIFLLIVPKNHCTRFVDEKQNSLSPDIATIVSYLDSVLPSTSHKTCFYALYSWVVRKRFQKTVDS